MQLTIALERRPESTATFGRSRELGYAGTQPRLITVAQRLLDTPR